MRGWALSEIGQPGLGRAEMRRGIENWRATGAELPVGYYRSLLANAYGAAGEPAQGLELIREAIAASNRSEERWWQAELWRTEAELSLLLPKPDVADAERCLAQALSVSRHQQARSLELRAAISLFRLRGAQANADEARRSLIDAKEWFTEGTTSADYQDAVRLLAADRPSST
jgi:adenylate cyclase